jgi:N-acetylmuramoyl-L-alanine amidase
MGQCLGSNQKQRNKRGIAVFGAIAGSIVSLGLFATAATAARLQSWRFDANANRLEFTTDENIQPRVQLVPNPVRLVVDLPGVRLDRPTVNQGYSAAVRSIRVGQFDPQTARIVVELSPGYTVDPQQVKVNINPDASWSIDLPTPQWVQTVPDSTSVGSTPLMTPRNPNPSSLSPSVSRSTIGANANNTLEDILVTQDGFFLKTQQSISGVQVSRSRNRREIFVDLPGVEVNAPLTQNEYKISYHGVQRVSIRKLLTPSTGARVTFRVDRNSPDWFTSTSRFGGATLLPTGGAGALPNAKQPPSTVSLVRGGTAVPDPGSNNTAAPIPSGISQGTATLQNIALGGSQLLIQSDRPVYYSTGWDGPRYRITVRGAQWSTNIRSPQTGFGSAITDITLRQEGQNATILVTPTPGVRFGSISRSGSQNILLGFNRPGSSASSPTIFQPNALPNTGFPSPTLSPANGRRVVVIDPGHGGTDPGAVGIGGLRETNVVLPISLEVVRLLQQQGLQVYLTRADESKEVDLPPRVALAKQVRADVFVSIHANSINLSRPDINGTETYFAPGAVAGKELAQTILNSITRSVNIQSRGLHSARFYVIRNTTMPATLIETGFVTGAEDAPKLRDPGFQRQMAAAIAQGIIEFLNRR